MNRFTLDKKVLRNSRYAQPCPVCGNMLLYANENELLEDEKRLWSRAIWLKLLNKKGKAFYFPNKIDADFQKKEEPFKNKKNIKRKEIN